MAWTNMEIVSQNVFELKINPFAGRCVVDYSSTASSVFHFRDFCGVCAVGHLNNPILGLSASQK